MGWYGHLGVYQGSRRWEFVGGEKVEVGRVGVK